MKTAYLKDLSDYELEFILRKENIKLEFMPETDKPKPLRYHILRFNATRRKEYIEEELRARRGEGGKRPNVITETKAV